MSIDVHDFNEELQCELPALWRFALKLTFSQDDAADLVQRTCVKALEQSTNYTFEGKLRSWLFRIQHRIWLNELRHRKVRQHQSFSYMEESHVESLEGAALPVEGIRFDHPEGNVLAHQIIEAVNMLPENQRTVMLLVNVEGFTYAESASILEVPIGTVMSRLSRARMTIGENLLDKKTNLTPTQAANDSGATL